MGYYSESSSIRYLNVCDSLAWWYLRVKKSFLVITCRYDRDDGLLEAGSNLRPILVALAENKGLHGVEIRFKNRTRHGDEMKTEIIMEGRE